jgi:hypothetical protein
MRDAQSALEPEQPFSGKGATISPCGLYRYALWRVWSTNIKPLLVIGLNPSTADAYKDDQTIRRCINYASDWGMGGLLMGNLFAFRSTCPSGLSSIADPVGPDNDAWLLRMKDAAGMVLAAWGNHGDFRIERTAAVLELFPELYHLGLTKNGNPRHPCRLARALRPEAFNQPTAQVMFSEVRE